MRIAAIDIGTNSVHMIVVDVRPDLSFEVVDREKDMIRLGAGGLDGRNLSDQAMEAARQTLSKFRRLAEHYNNDVGIFLYEEGKGHYRRVESSAALSLSVDAVLNRISADARTLGLTPPDDP